MAEIDTFGEAPAPEPAGRVRRLTIIAQDPAVSGEDGQILTAEVTVPVDRLEPGPRGHRFHVVDYIAATGELVDPVPDLCDPDVAEPGRQWTCRDRFAPPRDAADAAARFPDGYSEALVSDPVFRAQNVYAIAARTLAAFEFALGRRIDWAFDGHQLYLVPHAFAEANAHYAREDRGLFFGYLPRGDGTTVYTCLSHDIVAHETTHAVLDGLRPRFLEPALPDQAGVPRGARRHRRAAVGVLAQRGRRLRTRPARTPRGRIPMTRFERRGAGVERPLQPGRAVRRGHDRRARQRAAALAPSSPLGDAWRRDPAFEEPHRRGEVLVAAVIDALVGMWMGRLRPLEHEGGVDRERAAEEGAKAAATC